MRQWITLFENAVWSLAREKEDACRDEIKSHIKTLQISPNTDWQYIETEQGKATVAIQSVYPCTDEPRLELFWLIAVDRGAGRAALKLVCDIADSHGVTLVLDAIPLPSQQDGFKIDLKQLVRFYESFGFVKTGMANTGKHPHMQRKPLTV